MRTPVILIVDDEFLVRALAVDTVESAGYTASEASSADEAIQILESRSDISLVFTDVHMPGSMDGLRLAHAVRDRWPPVKIMVVSSQAQLSVSELPSDAPLLSETVHPIARDCGVEVLVGSGV